MDDKTTKSIGQKIRQIRIEKGLTQKQLGDMCGIADSNIRKYETGRQKPKLETLERIANALDIKTAQLCFDEYSFDEALGFHIDRINLMKAIDKIPGAGNTPLEQLTASFSKLNDRGQEKAARYVEDLTKIPEYKKTE